MSKKLNYYKLSCGFPFVLLYCGTKMQKQHFKEEINFILNTIYQMRWEF